MNFLHDRFCTKLNEAKDPLYTCTCMYVRIPKLKVIKLFLVSEYLLSIDYEKWGVNYVFSARNSDKLVLFFTDIFSVMSRFTFCSSEASSSAISDDDSF